MEAGRFGHLAISVGQHATGPGRESENCSLRRTDQEDRPQIGVAAPLDGADQHLIEAGRNERQRHLSKCHLQDSPRSPRETSSRAQRPRRQFIEDVNQLVVELPVRIGGRQITGCFALVDPECPMSCGRPTHPTAAKIAAVKSAGVNSLQPSPCSAACKSSSAPPARRRIFSICLSSNSSSPVPWNCHGSSPFQSRPSTAEGQTVILQHVHIPRSDGDPDRS